LVNVPFIKRIDRAKADALVAGLIERAKEINEDDRFVLRVTELRAFGSYIEPDKNDLGDVDIAFAVEVKPAFDAKDVTGLSKRTQHFFPDIPPRNFLDFLFLPRKVVLRTLKNRSPYLSLHPIEDLAKIGVTGRTVFTVAA
jgi:predicted nucleotidyltransferase